MDGVIYGVQDTAPFITFYSREGIGKSTFAAQAPNPIFIPTERIDTIDAAKFPVCKSWEELLERLSQLATQPHDFKTVVLDTADWAEHLLHQHIAEQNKVSSIELVGYGKGYVYALEQFRVLLDCLDYLRAERNMIVVVLAHSTIRRFDDPESDSYDVYKMKLRDEKPSTSTLALLQERSDIVMFANFVKTVKNERDGLQPKNRVMGGDTRMIYTTPRPSAFAKNRYNLPVTIPFTKEGSAWGVLAENVPFLKTLKV